MLEALSAAPHAPSRTLAVAGATARHALCLILPLATLAYVLTGPHGFAEGSFWYLLVAVLVLIDVLAPADRRQPIEDLPDWPFDILLYLLSATQIACVAGFAATRAHTPFLAPDTLLGVVLVGLSSGYSGIVVAHELIHRPRPHLRLLGRVLLGSVMYEHFYTEHVRGHHARVGTPEDPATARFGENYRAFFWRTVPAQWRSAWRLETARLGDVDMPWYDRRQLGSRVLQGLVAEWIAALALLAAFGPASFARHLLQAFVAIRLLEAVNFFEHWGLTRSGRRVEPVDSWDAESWFTRHTLVGLSRHADHHAYASRPYGRLRAFAESPKLPTGYYGSALCAIFSSRMLTRSLAAELERLRMGPFAGAAAETETTAM